MTLVMIADPLEMLLPYTAERVAAEAAGARFALGDGTYTALRDADYILTAWTMRFPADVLRTLPRCRMIARYGIGVDNIDVDAASKLGIIVANAPTYCVDEVADHAAGLILAIARGIPWLDQQVRAGGWMQVRKDDPRVPRIRESTIGIVGIGKIGRRVARRMAPFGCRILAYDPYLSDSEIRARGAEPATSLEALLRESDIITLHVPLTSETHHLINDASLTWIRPSAVIVNTSRGGVIDENALLRALHNDRIFGVALDVVESEPLTDSHPLLTLDPRRVILTPHFGAWCNRSVESLQAEIAGALSAGLAGRLPDSAVNPDVQRRI